MVVICPGRLFAQVLRYEPATYATGCRYKLHATPSPRTIVQLADWGALIIPIRLRYVCLECCDIYDIFSSIDQHAVQLLGSGDTRVSLH